MILLATNYHLKIIFKQTLYFKAKDGQFINHQI